MLTLKQLQTFYWVARLGTLAKAAEKLHITQSAVTKRLQEVEGAATAPLFEGGGKKNLLTPSGRELLAECERLLALVHEFDRHKGAALQPARTLHVGLTELTALTWFTYFLRKMREVYPHITIQPTIGESASLRRQVEQSKLDMAFVAASADIDNLTMVAIGSVQFGWFSAPGTFRADSVQTMPELALHPVVGPSEQSFMTDLTSQIFEAAGLQPTRIFGGDNLVVRGGLVAAGVGIGCLPVALFLQDVAQGRMQWLSTSPPAPRVMYHCCFLESTSSEIGFTGAAIAKTCCVAHVDEIVVPAA